MSNFDLEQIKNNKRFTVLAKKLDSVLSIFDENIHIISNSNLNMTRNHPEYLNTWRPVIYKSKASSREILNAIISIFQSIFNLSCNLLSDFFFPKTQNDFLGYSKQKIDILFISHYLGQATDKEDLYYGDLLETLKKNNLNIKKVLIPQVKIKRNTHRVISGDLCILSSSMPRAQIVRYLYKNLSSLLKLLIFLIKNNFSFYEVISIIHGQFTNFFAINISHHIEVAIQQWAPSKVVMTFEGNSIEKPIFFICKKLGVSTIGYQHAPIIKQQHSIFNPIGELQNPNVILCSGKYTEKKFLNSYTSDVHISILGSAKNNASQQSTQYNKSIKNILLIPDGNEASVDNFFALGIYLAKKDSSRNIKIRSHPLLNHHLQGLFESRKSLNDISFQLSSNALDADLSNAYWVIYQNSSVSVQSLFFECVPIYFRHPLADIDPLYELGTTHFTARDYYDLNNIINNDFKYSLAAKIKIKRFAVNYFSPIKIDFFI